MISKQFLLTGMFMGAVAMVLSAIFRAHLESPESGIIPDEYLALVTIHGTIMVFFVLTGGLSGTFANLLIPLQVGARDMASGFMNMLSYWFFYASCVVMLLSFVPFIAEGLASSGWTIYPPLGANPDFISGSGMGMTLWLISMTLFIISSLLGGLNYIVTILNLRTKGMSMSSFRLRFGLFCYSHIGCFVISCVTVMCFIISI